MVMTTTMLGLHKFPPSIRPDSEILMNEEKEEVWVVEVPMEYPNVTAETEYCPDGLIHWDEENKVFRASTLESCMGFVEAFRECVDIPLVAQWNKYLRIRNLKTDEVIAGGILL
jgi:hypothetical protein